MGVPADGQEFISSGLAALGIEADEVELAVMGAIHQTLWPPIRELLELDLGEVEVERETDVSGGPR